MSKSAVQFFLFCPDNDDLKKDLIIIHCCAPVSRALFCIVAGCLERSKADKSSSVVSKETFPLWKYLFLYNRSNKRCLNLNLNLLLFLIIIPLVEQLHLLKVWSQLRLGMCTGLARVSHTPELFLRSAVSVQRSAAARHAGGGRGVNTELTAFQTAASGTHCNVHAAAAAAASSVASAGCTEGKRHGNLLPLWGRKFCTSTWC